MVGGLSMVFTRKALVEEIFIRKSANLSMSFDVIDATHFCQSSKCQPMPIGFYTRWEYDSEIQRFTPRQDKSRSFDETVFSYFQKTRPACRFESKVTNGRQKTD